MFRKLSTLFLASTMLVLAGLVGSLWAQVEEAEEGDKITLERAEVLEKTKDNPNVRKLKERVVVRHKGAVLYCDSAYLYENETKVDAFGDARLLGEDGTSLTSDSMFYDGSTRIARARGRRVVLIDEGMQLTTRALDYNLDEGVAYYYAGGKIVDPEKTLTSQAGSYDTNAKVFYFRDEVVLHMSRDGRKVETDYLTYNTISKIAFFQGPTWINSPSGTVYTELGTFNTETEESNFRGRSRVEDDKYVLEGDTMFFNNDRRTGQARGRVWMLAKRDSVIIEGDIGLLNGPAGEMKVFGRALLRQISNGDTLYLTADTLFSVDRRESNERYMLAYPQTRLFGPDFQAICDSLVYERSDSTIYFYTDPVIWSQKSQLTADSIAALMANNRLQKMDMRRNAFLISEDTLKNYNQLKGKNMQAFFQDNQIRKMEVRGNGQNIYFALEKDTLLIGMNRIDCSDMNVYFLENNQLHKIAYINKPDALFVPPHELVQPQTRLKNFRWREEERPQRRDMQRPSYLVLGEKVKKTYKPLDF
ncbi:MAG: hypothetical protein HC913_08650 [Microscillaceae bacterium]|nr:hypothetical protein [Microscillaceae bacterium]